MSQNTKAKQNVSDRVKSLITSFEQDKSYSISDVGDFDVAKTVSLATLKRDLSQLVKDNFLILSGETRLAKYSLSAYGVIHREFETTGYHVNKDYKVVAMKSYNFNIFDFLKEENLFTEEEIKILDQATGTYHKRAIGKSETIEKKELERFIIELSWKSSAIEGNTYSLLDTENLIRFGIVSGSNTKDEAIMILNHKKAFACILEARKNSKSLLSFRELENIHRLLVDGLGVNHGLRKVGVGITGTSYLPLDIVTQLEEESRKLIEVIKSKKDFYSKALIAVLGVSYLQSFEDGNKRTARLFANAMLVEGNYGPLSYRDVDENEYRKAIVIFYEQNSVEAFKKIFIEQYVYATSHYNIAPITA